MLPTHPLCYCGSKLRFKFCCFHKSSDEFLRDSSKFPIYECVVGINAWRSRGIAIALISRKISEKSFIFGMYFLDTYCLGLKDSFAVGNVSKENYLETREKMSSAVSAQSFDYEDCRSLILGCVDFAQRLGFETKGDWPLAKFVIEAETRLRSEIRIWKEWKTLLRAGFA